MTEEIRPQHYKQGGMEAWDVIEAFNLNFNIGNTFKYISRYDSKVFIEDKVKDLVKASTYINRELKILKSRILKPNFRPLRNFNKLKSSALKRKSVVNE